MTDLTEPDKHHLTELLTKIGRRIPDVRKRMSDETGD
jgi:hypothetical protein